MSVDSTSPIVVRIYDAISLVFPTGADHMPQTAVEPPPCALCDGRSRLPPARLGWAANGETERLFLVCDSCGWDLSDDEIERRILELVTASAHREAALARLGQEFDAA
jgi:hypothetical protein